MRSRYFFFLFLLTAICCLNCFETNGQSIGDRNRASATGGGSGSHTISGKVFLPDGNPAVGVKVTMNGAGFGSGISVTDNNGAFAFGSIPKGSYNFEVKAYGNQTARDSLTIERFATPSQGYTVILYLRAPGQAKSGSLAVNPLLAGVPKDAVSKFEKGTEKLSNNDAKGAVADFDAAIAAYPNFAAAHYQKGAAYLKLNDPDRAIESFVKAITIKQDYVEAKYGFGLAHFQKKDYVVAAAAFNDVVQARKDMAEAHLNLGMSLFHLKNIDAAEAELKSALSTKGGENLALAHLYLGTRKRMRWSKKSSPIFKRM